MGWARKNRASVRGGNLLDGGSEKCAHYSYHQDRNPESSFHGFVSYPRKVSPDGSLARCRIINTLSIPVCNNFHVVKGSSFLPQVAYQP